MSCHKLVRYSTYIWDSSSTPCLPHTTHVQAQGPKSASANDSCRAANILRSCSGSEPVVPVRAATVRGDSQEVCDGPNGTSWAGEGDERHLWRGALLADARYVMNLTVYLGGYANGGVFAVSLPQMVASSSMDGESVALLRDYVNELLQYVMDSVIHLAAC